MTTFGTCRTQILLGKYCFAITAVVVFNRNSAIALRFLGLIWMLACWFVVIRSHSVVCEVEAT